MGDDRERNASALNTRLGPAGLCKWPACSCYSPQGPQECRVQPRQSNQRPRHPVTRAYD